MLENNLRYAFLTTYMWTVFIKRIDDYQFDCHPLLLTTLPILLSDSVLLALWSWHPQTLHLTLILGSILSA